MMAPVSNDWQHPSKAIVATTSSKETGAFDAISWAIGWVDSVDDIASAPKHAVARKDGRLSALSRARLRLHNAVNFPADRTTDIDCSRFVRTLIHWNAPVCGAQRSTGAERVEQSMRPGRG